jgi:hypothetical protein
VAWLALLSRWTWQRGFKIVTIRLSGVSFFESSWNPLCNGYALLTMLFAMCLITVMTLL